MPISLTVSPIRDLSGEIVGASKIARDLSRTQRVQRDASRLAAIVDSSDDAIVGKDLNSIVTSWNAAAQRMFGYSAEEMIGKSVRLLIPDDRQHEEDDVLSRITRGQRLEHYETIRRRKDGTLFPVSLTVSPVFNDEGVVIGASKIARDITERVRADEERRRVLEMAQGGESSQGRVPGDAVSRAADAAQRDCRICTDDAGGTAASGETARCRRHDREERLVVDANDRGRPRCVADRVGQSAAERPTGRDVDHRP